MFNEIVKYFPMHIGDIVLVGYNSPIYPTFIISMYLRDKDKFLFLKEEKISQIDVMGESSASGLIQCKVRLMLNDKDDLIKKRLANDILLGGNDGNIF